MKSIVISLVIIFAVVHARPNELSVAEPNNYLEDEWNTHIDKIVDDIVKHKKNNDTLLEDEIILNPGGKTTIKNASLSGFSTLRRSGDVIVKKYIGETQLVIPCSFAEMQYTGHYASSLGNKISSGSFVGTISNSTFSTLVFYLDANDQIITFLSNEDQGDVSVKISEKNVDSQFESMILAHLTEYSTRVTEKTLEVFRSEIYYVQTKIQEEIDNRKRSTTAKYTK